MWEFVRKVRYYETDRMGVVHHSNYLRFLEDARMDWIEAHVMDYAEMEKMGIIIPCINSYGEFKGFLRYGDEMAIQVRLIEYNGVRMKLAYEVYNAKSRELCYVGTTAHCFTRDGDYKPMPLRHKWPDLHEKFKSVVDTTYGAEEVKGN